MLAVRKLWFFKAQRDLRRRQIWLLAGVVLVGLLAAAIASGMIVWLNNSHPAMH